MARTADAAGADALLVGDANADPWNPNAIRASTGAVFTLPILEVTRDDVASSGAQKIAAVLGAPTQHTAPDYTDRPPSWSAQKTQGSTTTGARSPTRGGDPDDGTAADSLNASTAAAVLLFETVRQRSAT